jgi:hypothetical protein
MKTKTVIQKWLLLASTIVLLVTALGIFALPAAAADPQPPLQLVTVSLTVQYQPDPSSYRMNIFIDGNGPKAGWCINKPLDIIDDWEYTATLYDYFGRYQDQQSQSLLDANALYILNSVDWNEIAYILNNKGSYTATDLQDAIWYFTHNLTYAALSVNAKKIVDAAAQNPNFVPTAAEIRPIICFVKDNPYSDEPVTADVQPVFFEYQGRIPNFPVPELPSLALFGLGLAGIGGFIVSKRRAVKPVQ